MGLPVKDSLLRHVFLACIPTFLLMGCQQKEATVEAYGYVQKDPNCTNGDNCGFKRAGEFLFNVSAATQQVTYQYIPEGGNRSDADFTKLEHCVVVSASDFKCDGLSRVQGAFVIEPLALPPVNYISDSFIEAHVDNPTRSSFKFVEDVSSKVTWPWIVGGVVVLMLLGAVAG
ncbi:hypothetical protein BCh11DRAFT_04150 [Burkholderia sp. Ch1-1]|nr:hypothetical protein BCh11DRAFT_04150 [Burkholderia sp. Ch1-1]